MSDSQYHFPLEAWPWAHPPTANRCLQLTGKYERGKCTIRMGNEIEYGFIVVLELLSEPGKYNQTVQTLVKGNSR